MDMYVFPWESSDVHEYMYIHGNPLKSNRILGNPGISMGLLNKLGEVWSKAPSSLRKRDEKSPGFSFPHPLLKTMHHLDLSPDPCAAPMDPRLSLLPYEF